MALTRVAEGVDHLSKDDGHHWHLGTRAEAEEEPQPGQRQVAPRREAEEGLQRHHGRHGLLLLVLLAILTVRVRVRVAGAGAVGTVTVLRAGRLAKLAELNVAERGLSRSRKPAIDFIDDGKGGGLERLAGLCLWETLVIVLGVAAAGPAAGQFCEEWRAKGGGAKAGEARGWAGDRWVYYGGVILSAGGGGSEPTRTWCVGVHGRVGSSHCLVSVCCNQYSDNVLVPSSFGWL